MTWYLEVLRRYARFSGRASRKEYWCFVLFNLLVQIGLMFVTSGVVMVSGRSHFEDLGTVLILPVLLYWFAVLIPALAVTVRRLHDTGRSGWWFLIVFVPFAGNIILLVFTLLDGDPAANMYGPNPKGDFSYGQVYPA